MADTNTTNIPSYAEIKTAVFHSHEKPELLANIIARLVNKEDSSASNTPGKNGE